VRKAPWYEAQRLVQNRGEVFYNGIYALEREDERQSALVARGRGGTWIGRTRGGRGWCIIRGNCSPMGAGIRCCLGGATSADARCR